MLETLYKRQEGVLIQEDLDRLYRQGWRLISFTIDPHDIHEGYHYYFEREIRKESFMGTSWLIGFLWLVFIVGVIYGWIQLVTHA